MFDKIKDLLGIEHEIDSKPFRKIMRVHGGSGLLNITDVKVTKRGSYITVHITTHLPGILIGKAGKNIEELRNWFGDFTNSEVRINIIESEMFSNFWN